MLSKEETQALLPGQESLTSEQESLTLADEAAIVRNSKGCCKGATTAICGILGLGAAYPVAAFVLPDKQIMYLTFAIGFVVGTVGGFLAEHFGRKAKEGSYPHLFFNGRKESLGAPASHSPSVLNV